ncbi:ankyrin repeat, partial [Paramuricea clavata]
MSVLIILVKSGYEVARLKSPFTFDDSETEDGQTALYWAARRGDGAMVANLLEKGAQVDARDK